MGELRTRADLALTAVAIAWGGSFVVIKSSLDLTPPHWLLFLRFGLAALVMLAFAPRALRSLDAATLRAGLWLGVLLWVAFAFQTLGLVHTTPAKSAFLTATYVPMVPLLGRLLFAHALSARVLVSVLLALAGLALLLHPGELAAVNRGDVLTLASALGFALHILGLGRVAARLGARPLALLQVGATGAVALPVALATETAPVDWTAPLLAAIAYLALVCSALAYGVQTWAQRHTQPSRVALIFSLESVFAALFAVALYGERLRPGEWLGGALVVAAVVIGRSRPTLGPAATESG